MLSLASPCQGAPENHPSEQGSGIVQGEAKVHGYPVLSIGTVTAASEPTAAALENMYAQAHVLTCIRKPECAENKKPFNVNLKVTVSPSSCGCWQNSENPGCGFRVSRFEFPDQILSCVALGTLLNFDMSVSSPIN